MDSWISTFSSSSYYYHHIIIIITSSSSLSFTISHYRHITIIITSHIHITIFIMIKYYHHHHQSHYHHHHYHHHHNHHHHHHHHQYHHQYHHHQYHHHCNFSQNDRFSVASCYGPISVSSCPLLIFKRRDECGDDSRGDDAGVRCNGSQWVLVATGSLMNIEPDRIILKKVL